MSKKLKKKVTKNLVYRTQELADAICIINDSLKLVKEGKNHQFIPMYGQLRAILHESGSNKPLLLELAELLKEPLEIYAMGPVDSPDHPGADMDFMIDIGSFGLEQAFPNQQKKPLKDYLEQAVLKHNGKPHTAIDLIRGFADRAGGAHYDTTFPEDFAQLIGQFDPQIKLYLVNLASVCRYLALRVLRKISDIEIVCNIYIPEQPLDGDGYIFDYVYPNMGMRMSLLFRDSELFVFELWDLDGKYYKVEARVKKPFERMIYIAVSAELNEDLTTKLQLLINDEVCESITIDLPLKIRHQMLHYEMYYSASFQKDQALCFGITLHGVRHGVFDENARQNTNEWAITSNKNPERDKKLVWYLMDSYGLSTTAKPSIKMTGTVKLLSIAEFQKTYPSKKNWWESLLAWIKVKIPKTL